MAILYICIGSFPYLIFVIFFTLTHFESWKFYTRKVRKFTTNGAQSSNFLFFSGIFLHSAKNFTLTALPALLTNIRYVNTGTKNQLSAAKMGINPTNTSIVIVGQHFVSFLKSTSLLQITMHANKWNWRKTRSYFWAEWVRTQHWKKSNTKRS